MCNTPPDKHQWLSQKSAADGISIDMRFGMLQSCTDASTALLVGLIVALDERFMCVPRHWMEANAQWQLGQLISQTCELVVPMHLRDLEATWSMFVDSGFDFLEQGVLLEVFEWH